MPRVCVVPEHSKPSIIAAPRRHGAIPQPTPRAVRTSWSIL
jgi:hypothetical protein